MRSWSRFNHPNSFQGNLKKKYYFEGWYNKIISADENSILTFIPTIALNKKQGDSHSAIQFYDGIAGITEYFRYKIEKFENLSKQCYRIKIGNNIFSENGMNLNINKQGYKIKGILKFTNLVLWERNIFQPGVMGIFSYFPLMETYHGIVSMNHNISGTLQINDSYINFDNGRGYIEKDWGSSFPSSWIWMHSNHFSNPNLSLIFSMAKVPILNFKFTGFLCIIWHNNRFYKFTTFTRAKLLRLEFDSHKVKFIIKNKHYILTVKAIKGSSVDLKAPRLGIMEGHCIESMTSTIQLNLFKFNKYTKKYEALIKDIGRNAGLEIMDNNEF
jgi:hypothetical protein